MLLFLILFTGCSKEGGEKDPIVAVEIATVKQTEISHVISTEAVFYPHSQAAISPKITAPVKTFYVNRGDRVHRGQLLAILENRDLEAATVENKGLYEQAQAGYETTVRASLPEEIQKAELDAQAAKEVLNAQQKLYDSRKTLYDQGALPRKELDQASVALTQTRNQNDIAQKHLSALHSVGKQQELKAASGQLAAAKGKYLGAEAQMSYSEIRSPIDGVVTDRPLFPGEVTPSGTPLMTVMDISQVIAKAHIPQPEAVLLKTGDTATLDVPGIESPLKGKVTVISPALDPNSTTVEVWVQVPNQGERLKPGTSVRLFVNARTIPNALVIPASAILPSPEGKNIVMIVGADGRAHQREVQIGIKQGDHVEVVSGLKAGEPVIQQGAYGLPDNTRVRVEGSASTRPAVAK